MAIADFLAELEQLLAEGQAAFGEASTAEDLEFARVAYLGAKNGRIKGIQKQMGSVGSADRRTAGMKFNEVKQGVQAALDEAQQRLAEGGPTAAASSEFDHTVPGVQPKLGRLHPITQTIEELKDIMGRLGFTVADGPEIEDEYHNFEALNIPRQHPARDPLDNFYLSLADKSASRQSAGEGANLLLRSQTSTVQIRVMERTPPPVRIISLGRVYRPDTADATHYPMFHQMEGLLIDTHVTMADLKSVLRMFASS